ncbi:MAG: MFS transporter [Liquorilactobacillus hordei]|uniref:MFS transporter n=1 Tax=Liquorilactobacillus hordei TaxID=468911 RepID=UPI0039E94150
MKENSKNQDTQSITNRESDIQIFKDVLSNFIGTLSGSMFTYGMGYMLLDQTGLAMSFGIDMLITPIIGLLFLIPVGNLTDRLPHKKILIWSILSRLITLAMFMFTINHFYGLYKLIPVVIFLTINAISVNFSSTSYSASVHELVNDTRIQKLGSLSLAATSLSSILSPAIGATLYSAVGFDSFIYIEIIATISALLILKSMHFHYDKSKVKQENISFKDFEAGLAYIKKRALLKYVIIIAVVINFIFTALSIGIPFIIKTQLKLQTSYVGFLQSSLALGMLMGSFLMMILPDKKWFAQKILIPLLLFGVEFIMLGFIFLDEKNRIYLVILGMLVMMSLGLTLSILNIAFQVRLQTTTPTHILGRIMSILSTANSSIMPLGILFYTMLFQNGFAGGYIFILNGIVMFLYTILLFSKLLSAIKIDDILNEQQVRKN